MGRNTRTAAVSFILSPLPVHRPTKLHFARELARAFLAKNLIKTDMLAIGMEVVSGKKRASWIRGAVARVTARFPPGSCPSSWTIGREILEDPKLARALGRDIHIAPCLGISRQMTPAKGCADWLVPPLLDHAALEAWLLLSPGELEWFADPGNWARHLPARDPRLHYRHRTLPKASGGTRLIEAPKDRLRVLQQRILHGILERVPPHPAATGFRKGASILDYVRPHIRRKVIVHIDIRHFFPSIGKGRIAGLFRCAGYPESVADSLALLCLTATPESVCATLPWADAARFRQRHLPQGAPTSPLLASLAAFHFDRRLAGLATAAGARYTRYADDLAFSWPADSRPNPTAFVAHVGGILVEEGFEPHPRKTRVLGCAQSQRLTGVIINDRPNMARREYDVLKAILHNARRDGLAAQNRGNHPDFPSRLRGRIAWLTLLNPARGQKLLHLLESLAPPH